MDQLSIEEAARRLGLHPAHVRRLVREGEIPAQKVGARWLVTESALRERDRLQPSAGRPLSPGMAWAVLEAVEAGLRAGGSNTPACSDLADRRVRYRLRRLLCAAPPPEKWAGWLRRRARSERVWAHPGVVERLAADSRLHPGAASAAAAAEVGVGAGIGAELVFYLEQADLDGVLRDYRARADPAGQLLLMVVPDGVAHHLRLGPGAVPAAVALVDLLNAGDARQRALAAELLGAAARRLTSEPSRS